MSIVCSGRFCAGGSCGGLGGAWRMGPIGRGVRSMLSRMVCAAGRWLSGIALQIRCAGEHVLVRTNRLRTMCWLVVVGCAGGQLPRGASLSERWCRQSRVCAPVSCTTMRSTSQFASQELAAFGQCTVAGSLGAAPKEAVSETERL